MTRMNVKKIQKFSLKTGVQRSRFMGRRPVKARPFSAPICLPDMRDGSLHGPAKAGEARLPPVEETFKRLEAAMAERDPRSLMGRPQPKSGPQQTGEPWARVVAWGLCGILTVIALPVATALAIISLRKGANLRLAAQSVALTGTFIALNGNAATASTLHAVSHFLS